MILADTDVLIDYLAGVQPMRDTLAGYAAAGRLQTSVINLFELLSGAKEGTRGDRVRRLVALIPIIVLDKNAAELAAQVRRDLEREGQAIGMGDSLIAGIALSRRLPLLTRNRKHFERVPHLSLV